MGVAAAELRAQKCIDVDDLHYRSVQFENRFRLSHAQLVPVIVASDLDDVPVAVVHVEETCADALPRDATYLGNSNLHRLGRQMLKQIMHETVIERLILGLNLERIAHLETRLREHLFRVADVLFAQVKSHVVNQPPDAKSLDKPVVISRAAGRLQHRDALRLLIGQYLTPNSLKSRHKILGNHTSVVSTGDQQNKSQM